MHIHFAQNAQRAGSLVLFAALWWLAAPSAHCRAAGVTSEGLTETLTAQGTAQLGDMRRTFDQTIELKFVNGRKIRGVGCAWADPKEPGWRDSGVATHLHFMGPAGSPAIRLVQCSTLDFEGMVISRDSPGPLFQVEHGSSNLRWERVTMAGVGSRGVCGIVFGSDPEDHNCDTSVVEQCIFQNLDVCVRQNNQQSVANSLRNCHANFCNVLIDCVRGGDVHVDGGAVSDVATLFRITGGGGANSACFSLRNMRIDSQQAVNEVCMCDASRAAEWATIRFLSSGCTVRNNGDGVISRTPLIKPPLLRRHSFIAFGENENYYNGHVWLAP